MPFPCHHFLPGAAVFSRRLKSPPFFGAAPYGGAAELSAASEHQLAAACETLLVTFGESNADFVADFSRMWPLWNA